MQNGRGKIFLEFGNNFPLARDQEVTCNLFKLPRKDKIGKREDSQPRQSESVASSLGLPREKPWDEVD